VTDDGPGLDREQIVRLFAVNRPMTSTKLARDPALAWEDTLARALADVTPGAAG
jgi:hypothetical protein